MKIFIWAVIFFPFAIYAQYTGTGSVSRGKASTTQTNLFICSGGRTTNVGSIKATDSSVWTVPAATNYTNPSMPFAPDLYNGCNGNTFSNANEAEAAFNEANTMVVDADGEIITAYVFADNYFELYINGIGVGKDKVPYTPFNSSLIQFKVKKPFSIAFHVVDWEEHLGLGTELNGPAAYHPGDGGLVAIFKDASNVLIAKTDSNWKAQTFYSAPIKDLTCPTEEGSKRLSNNCSVSDTSDGTSYYALHWSRPVNCFDAGFDDQSWPSASTFSNAIVGVNNKPAYTNFTNIFDNPFFDADFIWSTNLILDNEVVMRYRVGVSSAINPVNGYMPLDIHFNAQTKKIILQSADVKSLQQIQSIRVFDELGSCMLAYNDALSEHHFDPTNIGIYYITIEMNGHILTKKIAIF